MIVSYNTNWLLQSTQFIPILTTYALSKISTEKSEVYKGYTHLWCLSKALSHHGTLFKGLGLLSGVLEKKET
jgi:hypothetical protein